MTNKQFMVAEEACTCNAKHSGCVIFSSIGNITDWSEGGLVLAHQVGHTLGVESHDGLFYDDASKDKMIMWQNPSLNAFIWSPYAREAIMKHDNSCLDIVTNDNFLVY